MINVAHFDIMADTAGYSGLNRSNDNNLLYNRSCMEVLLSCVGISTTLWKIPLYLKDTTGSKRQDLHVSFFKYVSDLFPLKIASVKEWD